ncbi:carboxypeptidase-like regulatory domain-containing protein [Dermatophilaceae bacterium Soc4.6]
MTTRRRHRPGLCGRRLTTTAAIALAAALLAACGSVPYAADAGSATASPAGGGVAGSTGGSTGGDASTGRPAYDAAAGPDTAVSSVDQPGQGEWTPAIAGRVTDGAGKPVSGLLVSVVSHGDPMVAVPEIGVLTGDDGRYAWPALPPGPWEVQVTRDGQTASVTVTLEAGRTATADLVLR